MIKKLLGMIKTWSMSPTRRVKGMAKQAITSTPHHAEHRFKTVEKGKRYQCRFCGLQEER